MIPQNIKSEIDKYKSRIPTDDELTALFDLVNSAKLKGTQQVEVWDYFEQVQEEAKSKLKAKEQDVLDKQKKEKEARNKRLAAEREKAEKICLANKICLWVFGITFGIFIIFGVISYFKVEGEGAWATMLLGPILGILVAPAVTWIVEKVIRFVMHLKIEMGLQCMQ